MKQRINILFLDHQSEMGGAEFLLLGIVRALNKDIFKPIVMLGEEGKFNLELSKSGADVIVTNIPKQFRALKRDPSRKNSILPFLVSIFALCGLIGRTRRIIKENKINIVFANTVKSAIFGIPAAKLARVKVAWWIHDRFTKDFYKPIFLKGIKHLAGNVDKIICNSEGTRSSFLRLAGNKAKNKAVVIYNGVDLDRFSPDLKGENVRKELSLKGERIIGLIGRFEPWKGQDVFIKAAGTALGKNNNLKFILAGGPLFGREEYEKQCRDLAKSMGIEDRIMFLGFRDDIPEIIAASDVIVHTSILPEPFGRDIIEAMACGKPVISTNVGGPREIITSDTGILIEPDDPGMLAEAIIRLSDDPDRMELLGRNARKRAEEKFDITEITGQMENIIKKEIEKGSLRVAIVHDYLVSDAGAEKVLKALMEVFPEAPVFTLFYDRGKFRELEECDIRVSFMDKLPLVKEKHHIFLPLYPLAVMSLNLKDYDVILSSSWAWSKGLRKPSKACHICYCHTPMRFVDGGEKFYLKNENQLIKWAGKQLVKWLKVWDIKTAKGVDYFIANSQHTADRIRARYRRMASVIHPAVDVSLFTPDARQEDGEYFLIVSRLVPYKRVDIAIEAFNELGLQLKIVGDGPEYSRLKKMAKPNVEILGYVESEQTMLELYRGCKAFIMPQHEDWGIAPLEAQACGKPVIAYARGGALEYVIEGKTGQLFYEQTPEAIMNAVRNFKKTAFDPGFIRDNALKYDTPVFKKQISDFVEDVCEYCPGIKG
ncbi:glycosyltransferase family 4 protein [Candidatus Omnitrophota bacterium]